MQWFHLQGNMAKDEIFLPGMMMKHRHPVSSNFPTILLFIVLLFAGSLAAPVKDTLLSGQCISATETLTSKSGTFELGLFAQTFYHSEQYYCWGWGIRYKSMTQGPEFLVGYGRYSSNSSTLCFLAGKLYIEERGSDSAIWPSDSERNGSVASVAILLDTGNFVVRDEMNPSVVMWQSFDHLRGPSDAKLPGATTGAYAMAQMYNYPPYNCTLEIDKSRKRGFAIHVGGASYGSFPDWMVAYQNVISVQLNVPKRPNDIELLKLDMGQMSLLRCLATSMELSLQLQY
nr:G-type lectin S-receptor-like serine/threonine-protein kinase At4g27290 [Setaria viridis]